MELGRSPYTLFVDMCMNGVSGQDSARGLQHVKGTQRIHLEIEKRDRCGAVVRRLRGGMHDQRRTELIHQREDAGGRSRISRSRWSSGGKPAQAFEGPAGVAFRTEEGGSQVVVDAGDAPAEARKIGGDFGADQAAGAGD